MRTVSITRRRFTVATFMPWTRSKCPGFVACLLPTSLARKVMLSVVSVRPFVSALSFEPTGCWSWFYVCIYVSRGLKVKAIGYRPRSRSKVNAKFVCGVLWVLIDGRSSRFLLWRDQLRASAARRDRGQWRRRSLARVIVVSRSLNALTSILDWRQFFGYLYKKLENLEAFKTAYIL